ncbi:MAG TPA: hypothetical protein VFS79_10025, partial [Arthrobacter sp.]|nr:hypothetical protein [Arthrobacter sp.]
RETARAIATGAVVSHFIALIFISLSLSLSHKSTGPQGCAGGAWHLPDAVQALQGRGDRKTLLSHFALFPPVTEHSEAIRGTCRIKFGITAPHVLHRTKEAEACRMAAPENQAAY